MEPFIPTWDRQRSAQVQRAFAGFTFPAISEGTGWRFGCDPSYLKQLCHLWCTGFGPAEALEVLSRFPHFMAEVDGVDLHFVHVVGEAGGSRPLLLSHGWPGSFFEFWDVVGPLAFPSQYGGNANDALDLVIPSLPGYGFSAKPPGITGPRRTAALFDKLMREVLGYEKYLAHGVDWGAGVAAWIALDRPTSVSAIHLGYLLTRPAEAPQSDIEISWKAEYEARQEDLGAYSRLQETKPVSLAYMGAGNPVGQLAWIIERFHDWADTRRVTFEDMFTPEQLLTNAMLYILTDSFDTSIQYYAHAELEHARFVPPGSRIEVPTAFSAYPSPAFPTPPREWVERVYHVDRWRNMPEGGHFPAMEVPELFIHDLRSWASSRRHQSSDPDLRLPLSADRGQA